MYASVYYDVTKLLRNALKKKEGGMMDGSRRRFVIGPNVSSRFRVVFICVFTVQFSELLCVLEKVHNTMSAELIASDLSF